MSPSPAGKQAAEVAILVEAELAEYAVCLVPLIEDAVCLVPPIEDAVCLVPSIEDAVPSEGAV